MLQLWNLERPEFRGLAQLKLKPAMLNSQVTQLSMIKWGSSDSNWGHVHVHTHTSSNILHNYEPWNATLESFPSRLIQPLHVTVLGCSHAVCHGPLWQRPGFEPKIGETTLIHCGCTFFPPLNSPSSKIETHLLKVVAILFLPWKQGPVKSISVGTTGPTQPGSFKIDLKHSWFCAAIFQVKNMTRNKHHHHHHIIYHIIS